MLILNQNQIKVSIVQVQNILCLEDQNGDESQHSLQKPALQQNQI